jgi:HTH-type transcriptional repressor of puuD
MDDVDARRGSSGPASSDAQPRRSQVIASDGIAGVDRGAGVVSLPYIGMWNNDQCSVTTGMTVFAARTAIPLHTHNVEETVLVLEGVATARIGNEVHQLRPGDATWVAAGVPHAFSNPGPDPLRIHWVYAGRYVTRTTCGTGETVEHLSDRDRGAVIET